MIIHQTVISHWVPMQRIQFSQIISRKSIYELLSQWRWRTRLKVYVYMSHKQRHGKMYARACTHAHLYACTHTRTCTHARMLRW